MAGFTPNEGETLVGNLIYKNGDVDRGTNLDLVLFTNASVDETITAATLTQPGGTGYAPITLTDASWVEAGDAFSYALQTYTGGAGGYTGLSVKGYAILTKGSTPRILHIEVDPSGPYTIAENDTYKVTPQNTVA